LRVEAESFGVDVVGGNIAKSKQLFIDITMLGEVEADRPVYRDRARPGDLVIVTGWPGESGAGLALLMDRSIVLDETVAERLLARHRTPTPRVAAGRAAATSGAAHAMIDVSDGLVGDLAHICDASGVGALLWSESLPISDALIAAGAGAGTALRDWVLFGGEDYELLIVASREAAPRLVAEIEATGVEATAIGEIVDRERGVALRETDGSEVRLERGGFVHF
jgi:thiamine-monophosphate kinase